MSIPRTIQAEDYDVAGEGVAYHASPSANGGQIGYRSDNNGNVRSGTGPGGNNYAVDWSSTGDWGLGGGNVAFQAISDPPAKPAEVPSVSTGLRGGSGRLQVPPPELGRLSLHRLLQSLPERGHGGIRGNALQDRREVAVLTDTGLTVSTKYNDKVTAINAKGIGAQSAAVSATAS